MTIRKDRNRYAIELISLFAPYQLIRVFSSNRINTIPLPTSRDMVKVKYLQTAYTTTSDGHFLTTNTFPPQQPKPTVAATTTRPSIAPQPNDRTAAVSVSPDIQAVLDVLPDLTADFVAALLERYAGSTEQVIAAVIEGNLPPDLLPGSNAAAAASSELETNPPAAEQRPALSSRAKNGDPFGFGDADVIVKRSKGFPGQPKTVAALLDDKSHVRELRGRYKEWGFVQCISALDDDSATNGFDDYDDEYDDSYDAMADSERRRAGAGAVARNPNRAVRDELPDGDDDDEEESDEEDDDEAQDEAVVQGAAGGGGGRGMPNAARGPTVGGRSGGGGGGGGQANGGGGSSYYDKSKDFCENPELVRERRAAAWGNKWAAKPMRKAPEKAAA